MHRVTVNFPEVEFEKVSIMADKKDLSLSEYLRNLIQIGMVVEEAADSPRNQEMNSATQKILWKKLLEWQLETRYLARHLTDVLTPANADQRSHFLKEAAQKAEERVHDILHTLSENAN